MSTSRRPAAATRFALGLATLALSVSGCALTSPAVITTPYAASDGTNADIGEINLRNFLLVTEGKGKPGVVVGAVSTDGTEPVQIRLTVVDPTRRNTLGQADLTVRPGVLTSVGNAAGSTPLQLESVPVPPGAVLSVLLQTSAGRTDFTLPVLSPVNEYASITPSATSTGPSGPSAGGSPSS